MRIPVHFIPCPAAVNDAALILILGFDDGRSEDAARKASYRFRKMNGIKTLPGGVYSVRAVERAINQQNEDSRVGRMR